MPLHQPSPKEARWTGEPLTKIYLEVIEGLFQPLRRLV